MALIFPSSPTTNQLFPAIAIPGEPQWRYDGNRWQINKPSAPKDGRIYGQRDGQWVAIPVPEPPPDVSVVPVGGQLRGVTTHHIGYFPFNGGWIRINGKDYPLPADGVIADSRGCFVNGVWGALADIFYRVYMFDNNGTLAMDFRWGAGSLSAHRASTTPGNVGTEILWFDDTRTFIGVVQISGGMFHDNIRYRYVRSWLNRPLTNLSHDGSQVNWNTIVPARTEVSIWMVTFADENLILTYGGYWQSNLTVSRVHMSGFQDNVWFGGYTLHCGAGWLNAGGVSVSCTFTGEGLHEVCMALDGDGLLTGYATISGLY